MVVIDELFPFELQLRHMVATILLVDSERLPYHLHLTPAKRLFRAYPHTGGKCLSRRMACDRICAFQPFLNRSKGIGADAEAFEVGAGNVQVNFLAIVADAADLIDQLRTWRV